MLPPRGRQCACLWESVCSYLGLEAAEELGQVRVLPGQRQDPLLRHGAVDVVVLQDHVLLQHLDGVHLVGALQLRQHHLLTRHIIRKQKKRKKEKKMWLRKHLKWSSHLPKAPFPQNFDEDKVVQVHPLDFWSHVTFDRSILFVSFALYATTAAATATVAAVAASFSFSVVPRDSGDRRGGGEWVCSSPFVLLPVMVEGQNLPDALQLLRIWEDTRTKMVSSVLPVASTQLDVTSVSDIPWSHGEVGADLERSSSAFGVSQSGCWGS